MAANTITASNIRSGKEIKVPAPGRIVSITYDCVVNRAYKLAEAQWERKTVKGIVEAHESSWDALLGKSSPALALLAIDGSRCTILFSHIVKASATRSIPKEARDALTSIFKWETSEAAKWDEKIRKLQEQKKAARAAAGADDVAATLAAATGCLTEKQFTMKLTEKLSEKMPSFIRDGWRVFCWNRCVSVCRWVDIEKYYNGPMSYLEYDDCRMLYPNVEDTQEGKSLRRKYRCELPIKTELEEYFKLGDKNYLSYNAEYKLANVVDQPLTEHLVEDIVSRIVKS